MRSTLPFSTGESESPHLSMRAFVWWRSFDFVRSAHYAQDDKVAFASFTTMQRSLRYAQVRTLRCEKTYPLASATPAFGGGR